METIPNISLYFTKLHVYVSLVYLSKSVKTLLHLCQSLILRKSSLFPCMNNCCFANSGASQVNSETGPCVWRARRDWGNRFVLGSSKICRSPHPPARVLKVYIEGLPRFRPTYCSDSVNTHCSLKAPFLKMGPPVGTVGRIYTPRTWDGVRSLGPA